jgi:hypothetical protein
MLSALLLCLAASADAPAVPPPVVSARLYAITGGWGKDSRYPASAVPTVDGDTTGRLEDAFDYAWQRRGADVRLTVTRLNDHFCGLIGVELVLDPATESLTYALQEMPVTEPLRGLAPGPLASSWNLNTPWWLLARTAGQSGGVLVDTADGHGFDSHLGADGAHFMLRFYLPKPGETKQMHLRFVPEADATALKRAARELHAVSADPPLDRAAAERLRATGLVRVDSAGTGFVTGDGRPFYPVGLNTYGTALPQLPPADQERRLARMAAAHMTATRIIITDWAYRPLPHVINDDGLTRLHDTLDRCASHGIRSLICLELGPVAYQYHACLRLSPYWDDLFGLPTVLDWYRELVDRVVRPLRDDPAVLAWTVTNEPAFNLFPNPDNAPKTAAFQGWLKARYGDAGGLRGAWQADAGADFEHVRQPDKDAFENQTTPAARDFLRYEMGITAQAMVDRAKLIKAADARHLVAISDGLGRGLRDVAGAEVFDFWAPHTYELWLNGPPIERHAAFLARYWRDALPDRRRPVIIEEFGISAGPKYPPAMRGEHVRQYLDAVPRVGLAGILHWDFEEETTPEVLAAFTATPPFRPTPAKAAPLVAAWLPPGEDFNIFVYSRYMTRRGWDANVAAARAAGCEVNVVSSPAEAHGAAALLVLADRLTADEARTATGDGLPLYVLPQAKEAARQLPGATALPADEAGQQAMWAKVAAGGYAR